MRIINVFLLMISVMFLTSCAELRYAAAQFRKTEKVAPKYRGKKTAIIAHGFSQDDVLLIENGLKTLGYDMVGNVTDCFDLKRNKKKADTENFFFSSVNCGKEVDAEFIINVTYGDALQEVFGGWVDAHTVRYNYYKAKQTSIDLFDAKKRKWLINDDPVYGPEDAVNRLLERFGASQN